MTPPETTQTRRCPGEKYDITLAICRARQANQYPKCLLCEHCQRRPDEGPSTDPKVKSSIFRPHSVSGEVPGEINEYVMRKIGTAAAQYLRAEFSRSPTMVVGCDGRESSRNLARVFCEGANSGGLHTLQVGTSTPAMAHFVLGTRKKGSAAFITGCQADANVNGVRLYRNNGVPLTFETGLDKVGLIARRLKPGRSKAPGRNDSDEVLEDYRSYVVKFAPRLRQIKVAVDGSCGAPGRVLPFVLSKLPVKVVRSHTEPDRRSSLLGQPHPCQQIERSIRERMRSTSCQIGIAVDYDGDMCAFYDEDGRPLRNDVSAALVAREMLHRMPGARIAYDLRFTAAVREEILRGEGRPHRTGSDPLALARATRQQEAVYAASMDGRHFFRDMFGAESPALALLMMCSLLSRTEQSLSSLAAGVARYAYSGQIRYSMPSPEATEKALEDVKDEFREADRDSIDGLTYRFTDWWFNLRQPPRTAALLLTVEGRDQTKLHRGRQMVDRVLKGHGAETLQ
jgi:phosphomannomutase